MLQHKNTKNYRKFDQSCCYCIQNISCGLGEFHINFNQEGRKQKIIEQQWESLRLKNEKMAATKNIVNLALTNSLYKRKVKCSDLKSKGH